MRERHDAERRAGAPPDRMRAIILACCALAASGAVAQTARPTAAQTSAAQTSSAQTADAKDDSARIVTPRKSDNASRMKAASAPKDASPVDWRQLRAQIAATRERDGRAASQSTARTAAPQRPAGIRRLDLRSLKTTAQAAPSQAAAAARAQDTKLPILVPAAPEFVEALKVYPLENAYAAHAKLADGTEIHVMGTRLRVIGGDPSTAKARAASRQRILRRIPELAAPYVVSRHEEGVDLSFSLFNVAYLVTVRCKDPDTDVRCTSENFIGSLVRDLGVLNADAGEGQ